jgi:hypothetical protein
VTLPNDFHSGNFLSLVIGNEDGGSMPAIVLRKFLGENESMRHGVAGRGKNGSSFVRIPTAVDNVEIKPASHNHTLCSGSVECMNSRSETLDTALGCWGHASGETAASWIAETREDMANRILKARDGGI